MIWIMDMVSFSIFFLNVKKWSFECSVKYILLQWEAENSEKVISLNNPMNMDTVKCIADPFYFKSDLILVINCFVST